MSFLKGCQEGKITPKLIEVNCPECGALMEMFVRMGGDIESSGRLVARAVCENCGYVAEEGSKPH